MTLYNSASLLTILNSQTELAAFPVEGDLSLLFSNQIDEQNMQSYVFLLRSKPNQEPLSISRKLVKYIGDINTIYYDVVPYTWSGTASTDASNPGWVYTYSPSEPLAPNVDYFLVISTSLAPLFYQSQKTNSLGPSSAGLTISPTLTPNDLPTNANTTWVLTITQTSVIGNGSHFIGYSLTKDSVPVVTNQQLEINSQVLTLDTGITVNFNTKIPFVAGEVFTFTILGFARAGVTYVQAITTNITNSVIQPTPEQQSTLLNQNDIIQFYERYGFSRRLGNPETVPDPSAPPLPSGNVYSDCHFKFRFPNQLFIYLSEAIDPATISANAFKISLSPAFDNAFLGNIGNYQNITDYQSNIKWVITYGLIPDDEGIERVIRLTIGQDTTGLVGPSDTFTVLPDGAVMGPNTTGNVRMRVTVLSNVIKTEDDANFIVFHKGKSHDFEDMLLMPMYALPGDIEYFFFEECVHKYDRDLWHLLFEGSLEADSIVTPYVAAYYNLTQQTIFYIKRRYVIAYVICKFSMIFYRDYLKAIKKSKFLADLKVSLDIEKDPEFIKALKDQACAEATAIKTGLNAPYNMQSFVKGASNSHNKTTARLWMPSLGNNFPDISMATSKSYFHGKLYKIADQFQHLYPDFYERNSGVLWNNWRFTNF